MRRFLDRLRAASGWGAALAMAACGSEPEPEPEVRLTPEQLTPAPALECRGPVHDSPSGFIGQCCDQLICRTPKEGLCPGPDDPEAPFAPGSGECDCEPGVRGPFANEEHPTHAESCCYVVAMIGCAGRPLMVDGSPRLAPVTRGPSDWPRAALDTGTLELPGLLPAARRALADAWMERARFEHASIASFARFTLELLALGAPAALVARSQQAGLDEVNHARIALAVAARHGGSELGFGPLPIEGSLDGVGGPDTAVLSAVIEGCVGETLSAIEASACAAEAGCELLREVLQGIAEDEARHAELAWAFVAWAQRSSCALSPERLRDAFEHSFEAALRSPVLGADVVAGHGFLGAAALHELRRRAIDAVLRPAAAHLAGGARARERHATLRA